MRLTSYSRARPLERIAYAIASRNLSGFPAGTVTFIFAAI